MDETAIALLMVSALSGVTVVSSNQACYNGLEYDLNSTNPHRWVLPHKDPCEFAAVLGGLTTQSASYRQGAPYYLDKVAIRLLEFFGCQDDRKEYRPTHKTGRPLQGIECSDPEPLGLEDRTIPDESISASSSVHSLAGRGRLNGVEWIPSHSPNSWLEVDLGESTMVSGVIMQGEYTVHWRVTEYKVKYKKLSSSVYDYVIDRNGAIQVFDDGNVEDGTTPVTNMFDQSIVATIVRIEPVSYYVAVAIRLELLGCQIN